MNGFQIIKQIKSTFSFPFMFSKTASCKRKTNALRFYADFHPNSKILSLLSKPLLMFSAVLCKIWKRIHLLMKKVFCGFLRWLCCYNIFIFIFLELQNGALLLSLVLLRFLRKLLFFSFHILLFPIYSCTALKNISQIVIISYLITWNCKKKINYLLVVSKNFNIVEHTTQEVTNIDLFKNWVSERVEESYGFGANFTTTCSL